VLCEPNISDISSIATLKETIKTKVVGIWTANLTIWHKVAFFLYPPAAHMQDTDLADIKQQCVSEMLKICIS